MKLQQLSVFLENKPGSLSRACRLLADAGLNIQTCALADTQQFGILRLVLPDGEKARALLEKHGCAVKVTEVVALEVTDQPGGLAAVLEVIERAGINIEYLYAFALRHEDKAILVFRFDNPDAALKALKGKPFNVVGNAQLSAWLAPAKTARPAVATKAKAPARKAAPAKPAKPAAKKKNK